MRTGTIGIDGKQYALCFSLRVLRSCVERYGNAGGLYEALSSNDELKALDESIWVLSEMMKAGHRYAKENGGQYAAPLSYDDLMDVCGIDDLVNLKASIITTVNNGRKTNVEATFPNAEATPGS